MGLSGAESGEYYSYIIDELEAVLDTVQRVKITGIPVCLDPKCSDEIDGNVIHLTCWITCACSG